MYVHIYHTYTYCVCMHLCIMYTDPNFMKTAASKTCRGLREECLRLQDKLDDHSLALGVCVYPSLHRNRNCNCNGTPRRMSRCTRHPR